MHERDLRSVCVMLNRSTQCRMLGRRRVMLDVRCCVNDRRGFRVRGARVIAGGLVARMFTMIRSALRSGRAMIDHVLVMVNRRVLFR